MPGREGNTNCDGVVWCASATFLVMASLSFLGLPCVVDIDERDAPHRGPHRTALECGGQGLRGRNFRASRSSDWKAPEGHVATAKAMAKSSKRAAGGDGVWPLVPSPDPMSPSRGSAMPRRRRPRRGVWPRGGRTLLRGPGAAYIFLRILLAMEHLSWSRRRESPPNIGD